jgi:hypothetical protein
MHCAEVETGVASGCAGLRGVIASSRWLLGEDFWTVEVCLVERAFFVMAKRPFAFRGCSDFAFFVVAYLGWYYFVDDYRRRLQEAVSICACVS